MAERRVRPGYTTIQLRRIPIADKQRLERIALERKQQGLPYTYDELILEALHAHWEKGGHHDPDAQRPE